MENVITLDVALPVKVSVGTRWGSLKGYEPKPVVTSEPKQLQIHSIMAHEEKVNHSTKTLNWQLDLEKETQREKDSEEEDIEYLLRIGQASDSQSQSQNDK